MPYLQKITLLLLTTITVAIPQNDSLFTTKNIQKSSNYRKNFLSINQWSEPKKASILSTLLPGAGQVFNKKIWKVPIIYGLEGIMIYSAIKQNSNYHYYKSELIKVINGGVSNDGYSAQQLSLLKNQSKKWRDLSIAGSILVYILNILDANVDAHLKTFDISDNLSFQINIIPNFQKHSIHSSNMYMLSLYWRIADN